MKYIKKFLNLFNLFFIIVFVRNFSFTSQEYNPISIKVPFSEDKLNSLYIKTDNETNLCEQWIPSLLSPILLVPASINTTKLVQLPIEAFEVNPWYVSDQGFKVILFNFTFLNKYNLFFGKEKFSNNVQKCYFGLNSLFGDYKNNLNESQDILSLLKNNSNIEQKIFSFKKWSINQNSIDTVLFFGDSHENFKSENKDSIIGSCKININDPYWGCSFKGMEYNNNYVELKNEKNGTFYKIYFSSEDFTIIFPSSFKKNFDNITNYLCDYNSTDPEETDKSTVYCKYLFDIMDYIPIKLINDEINITIEIDNAIRFSKMEDIKKNKSRIKYFDDIDYFVFPLIMFKQFHIEFDAENNLTKFFTTNSSILQINKEKKKEKDKGSSNGLKVFLIILIILIILFFGYGLFWFIRKRKNSVEKNINKYNKFEEEDNFKDMNEQRVF